MAYDFNRLTYQEFTQFVRAVSVRDVDAFVPFLEKCNTDKKVNYDDMDILKLVEEAGEATRSQDEVIKAISLDNVKAELFKWKRADYAAFRAARLAGDTVTAEEMMKKVVVFTGGQTGAYSYIEGIQAIRAIDEAYNKALSGKN